MADKCCDISVRSVASYVLTDGKLLQRCTQKLKSNEWHHDLDIQCSILHHLMSLANCYIDRFDKPCEGPQAEK